MAERTLASLANNLFNAAGGFTSTVAGHQNQLLERKAKADLFYIKEKLQADTNAFMLDLQNSNDYENWGYKLTDFMEKKKKQLGDKNSPYFCSNALTAKMADDMFLSAYNDLNSKIMVMADEKQRQDIIIKNSYTEQLMDDNYTGQDLINNKTALYDDEFNSGLIDSMNYENKVLNNANKAQQSVILSKGTELIQNAINEGKGIDYVMAELQKEVPDMTYTSITTGQHNVDKQANLNEARKLLEGEYNAQVSTLQKKNDSLLSEIYTKMKTASVVNGDNILANNICKEGLLILNQLKGNNLSTEDRLKYTKLFNLENFDNDGNLTKTGKENLSELKAKSLLILVENGTLTLYEAQDILTEWGENTYTDNTLEDKQKLIELNNAILNTDKIKAILKKKPSLNYKYEELKKNIENKPNSFTAEALSKFEKITLDVVATGYEENDAIEQLENAYNLLKLNEAANLYKLGNRNKSLLETDNVFTDIYGNETIINTDVDKKQKEYEIKKTGELQEKYGIKLNPPSYTLDKEHRDVYSRPTYDYNGKKYLLVENNKLVDEQGNELQEQNKNDAIKEAKGKREEIENTNDKELENLVENTKNVPEVISKHFSQQEWETGSKMQMIADAIMQITDADLKELNITKEEWDSLSLQQKQKLLLNS